MNTLQLVKTTLMVVFSLLTIGSFSQDVQKTTGNTQDCVKYIKMGEKFKASYAQVEVISCHDVNMNFDFEEAKNYMNAYMSIDLNEVEPDKPKQAINTKIDENPENLKKGLDISYPLTSND